MTSTPDFADRIRDLATRTVSQRDNVLTEEATKHAFVLPFIQTLGYDVFNPSVVTPELIADVGVNKGEKVDYAILVEGKPIMIFECKAHTCNLKEAEYSQLLRYFHVTDARFGVLTNGIQFWFFTDLDTPNKMDAQPFLKIDLMSLRDGDLDELKKFTQTHFDVGNILSTASELKYVREIKRALAEELHSPSDEFARLLIGKVYHGMVTARIKSQFVPFIAKAYQSHLSDVFSSRLKGVIGQGVETTPDMPEDQGLIAQNLTDEAAPSVFETTPEEIEAFLIIRAIGASEADVKRIIMRGVQSYCGILFDDNNRKPICRLYINGKKWQIGLFNTEGRTEVRHAISSTTDLYKYAEIIRETIRRHLPEAKSDLTE